MDLQKGERNVQEIDSFFEEDLNFGNRNLFDLITPNYADYAENIEALQIRDSNKTFNDQSNQKTYEEIGFEYQKYTTLPSFQCLSNLFF